MRLYIRKNGRVTSITVSDQLCHLLAVKLATKASQYVWNHEFKGRKLVQRWINEIALHTPVPDSNVSQWVQARIVIEIADPLIIESANACSANRMKSRKPSPVSETASNPLLQIRNRYHFSADAETPNRLEKFPTIRSLVGREARSRPVTVTTFTPPENCERFTERLAVSSFAGLKIRHRDDFPAGARMPHRAATLQTVWDLADRGASPKLVTVPAFMAVKN
ncbi:hypothetical protein ACJBUE_22980 (plasmid) [Ralstonia syzygii subsp. celebesensis]|uniref:hypothetical protein n=1 Tax=Ralstonia syzygii TaxID=28097 RepID=UPI00387E113C